MSELRIVEEPALAFMQRAMCQCGGEMQSTGIWLLSQPPLMPHRCITCGATANLGHSYPTVVYRTASPQDPQEGDSGDE